MISKDFAAFARSTAGKDRPIPDWNRKIVVATDLSPGADLAVRRAIMLAEQHGGSVMLVHVVDGKRPRRWIEETANRARSFLEDWYVPTDEGPAVAPDIRVEAGVPADTIAGIAAAEDAELLVFGQPRRRLLADAIGGATMERVLRATGLPGLAVNRPPRRAYRRILVGLNASDASRHAVARALELDLLDAAEIDIVHAFTVLGKARMAYSGLRPDELEEHVALAAAEARLRIGEFLSDSALPDFRRRIHVAEGEPDWVIERLAESLSTELVVIGSPAASGLARLVLGTVSGDILRRVGCDVLVVPASAQAAVLDGPRQGDSLPEPIWSVAS